MPRPTKPMRRTAELQRTAGAKRTGLPPVERERRARIKAAVFERDGHRCVGERRIEGVLCSGLLTVHHIRKASAGGKYVPENLVSLCAGMNTWVEDAPERAWHLGLVQRRGDTLAECWERMRVAGLVA